MKRILLVIVVGLVLAGGYYAYQRNASAGGFPGVASGNGRIEATEINIASKTSGRIVELLVNEGDYVTSGQMVARMDSAQLEAQLKQAEAQLRQAKIQVETSKIKVKQRESEKVAAGALVKQYEATLESLKRRLARSESLLDSQSVSREEVDDQRSAMLEATAAVAAAVAQVAAAEAAIHSQESETINAEVAVIAAEATIQRVEADIADCVLLAPRDGRIQYRVAQPGEVVGAGGSILNLIDLTDVYMTFFLPTSDAGRLAIGQEARIVLDAAPQHVIPARVDYVADVAQFTPKTVETIEEREKLMFRVKVRIDAELLRNRIEYVKTGLPGVAFTRTDPDVEWPIELQSTLE